MAFFISKQMVSDRAYVAPRTDWNYDHHPTPRRPDLKIQSTSQWFIEYCSV